MVGVCYFYGRASQPGGGCGGGRGPWEIKINLARGVTFSPFVSSTRSYYVNIGRSPSLAWDDRYNMVHCPPCYSVILCAQGSGGMGRARGRPSRHLARAANRCTANADAAASSSSSAAATAAIRTSSPTITASATGTPRAPPWPMLPPLLLCVSAFQSSVWPIGNSRRRRAVMAARRRRARSVSARLAVSVACIAKCKAAAALEWKARAEAAAPQLLTDRQARMIAIKRCGSPVR